MGPAVASFEVSQQIAKPVEEVFKFLATDYFQNFSRWYGGGVVLTQLSPGPVGKGTIGVQVSRLWVRKRAHPFEVTGYETNRRLSLRSVLWTDPWWKATQLYEPSWAETTVTVRCRLSLGGCWRFFEPLVARAVRRRIAAGLVRAKKMMEGMPPSKD